MNPATVERVLLFLGVAGPLLGMIVGIMLGAHERCAAPTIVTGVLIGASLTLAYGMWKLYGLISGMLGFDSIWNLVLQLVLFALVGVLTGAAAVRIGRLLRDARNRVR